MPKITQKMIDGKRHLRCASCERFLPADRQHFNVEKRKPRGFSYYCRWCASDIRNEHRARQKEKELQTCLN